MKVLLATLLFCGACAGVGWVVVSFAPVLDAASSESTEFMWAAGFAAPVLGLLIVWIVLWIRGRAGGVSASGVKGGLVFLVAPVFLAVGTGAERRVEAERAEIIHRTGFEPELNRYALLPRALGPRPTEDGAAGLIRGKLFVFDSGRREASPIHFRLPARLQPTSPAEVGTVACVRWATDPSGRWQRWVRLIDLNSGQVTYEHRFPKGDANALLAWLKDDADAQLLQWLEALPQRNVER